MRSWIWCAAAGIKPRESLHRSFNKSTLAAGQG
jgi:hypothetical protein